MEEPEQRHVENLLDSRNELQPAAEIREPRFLCLFHMMNMLERVMQELLWKYDTLQRMLVQEKAITRTKR